MAPELGHIGPVILRTYTMLLDLAILVGLGLLAWQGHRREQRAAAWIDAGLSALLFGVIAGRAGHILIYRAYFAEHPGEIFQLWRGGLDWHAAVLGGLIGLALACLWRRVPFRVLMDVLALILPIGAMLTYTGCLMSSCGHGREIISLANYPPPIAAELPDLFGVWAPRLISQLYGLGWSALVLMAVVFIARRGQRPGVRFWLALTLFAAGAFAVGFTRGDAVPLIGPLRLDQVLDLGIAALGIIGALLSARTTVTYTLYGPAGFIRR